LVSLRALLLAMLVLGLGYTAVVTAFAQLAVPAQANGSLATDASGEVVGSVLIGQNFWLADGSPDPNYFQSRPSAVDYAGSVSGGSNAGPENADLIAAIEERLAAVAAFNGVDPADVPADAVTASASGLDPHISVEYARLQQARVAAERGLDISQVEGLVSDSIEGRDLGILGEPRVNVLKLNLALDALEADA
jgi:K+-transporting ATPase ATPase C chain